MADEKLMILKMLEEGKINSEQASKLLEALNTGGKPSQTANTYTSKPEPPREAPRNEQRYNSRPAEPVRRGGVEGLDDFVNDLSRKFETLARDMEPTLQKITGVVVEKTADMADKLSKSISSATAPSPEPSRPAYSKPSAAPAPGGGMEKSFELKVSPGYNELNLSAQNGNVTIKGYNGDKITARIFYKTKKSGGPIEIVQLGSKYFLNYNEDLFDKVSIDAYVPEGMFNSVNISNINGSVDISTISTQYFTVSNSNGETKIKNIVSDNMKIEFDNGPLSIGGLKGKNASIEHYNGSIDAYDLDVKGMRLATGNGPVNLNIASLAAYADYIWQIETSNNKISVNLPAAVDLGYYVKATSSLGNIKVGLTGMNYIINSPSFVEAKSIDYDRAKKLVKISLETSNGQITIN